MCGKTNRNMRGLISWVLVVYVAAIVVYAVGAVLWEAIQYVQA